MDIAEQFYLAVSLIRTLTINSPLSVQLYAFFKQAREGNISRGFERPSILNMNARRNWVAWKSLENTSSERAKRKYIQIAYDLTGDDRLL